MFLTEVDWFWEWFVLCFTCSDLGKGGTFLIEQLGKGVKRRRSYCTGSWAWPLLFLCEEHCAASWLAKSKRGPVLLLLRWAESRRIPTSWNLLWGPHSMLFCMPPAGISCHKNISGCWNISGSSLCHWKIKVIWVQFILWKRFHMFCFQVYRAFHLITLQVCCFPGVRFSILLPLASFSGLNSLGYISIIPGQFSSGQALICITDHA